jgi:hypothetical protein
VRAKSGDSKIALCPCMFTRRKTSAAHELVEQS